MRRYVLILSIIAAATGCTDSGETERVSCSYTTTVDGQTKTECYEVIGSSCPDLPGWKPVESCP